jgi:hypothetical protein
LLAKIAVEAKDPTVRRAAVEKLTDQDLLAGIAVVDEGSGVRRAAAERLVDQALLAVVAVEDRDSDVRGVAAKRVTDPVLLARMGMWVNPDMTRQVTDPALLTRIVAEAKDSSVRRVAARNITDQALLSKIAVSDRDYEVRVVAVERLTDQALLARLAAEDADAHVHFAAVRTLTDQALLADLAVKAKRQGVRLAAIGKVTDQKLLSQWAQENPLAPVRQAAVVRITDEGFLVNRLSAEPSAAVRTAIVDALKGKEALRQAATVAYHAEDRERALRRLQTDLHDPAPDVATSRAALTRRAESIADERDNAALLKLALEGEFDVLRAAAARRLSDPASLEHVALRATDRPVLGIVLAKLEDNAVLARVAAGAADPATRLAAAQKAGRESWTQIFDAASAKRATPQMLGDAVAALSLFSKAPPDAVRSVHQACLNLIRLGDESRTVELVELLEAYGDKSLAEDYVNCGDSDLEMAAYDWGSRHDVRIGGSEGSNRANWGSDK